MRRVFIGILLFGLGLPTAHSQSSLYLKVYHNSDFYRRTENLYDLEARERRDTDYDRNNFNRFSIGAGLSRPKFYHELELSYNQDFPPIEHIARISNELETTTHFLSFHYEINKVLVSEKSFRILTGLGLNTYKGKSKSVPEISTMFPVTDRDIGSTLNLIPRISFDLSPKLGVELSSKIGLLNVNNYKSIVHNPDIPVEHQAWVDEVNWSFFPSAYNIRVGLFYELKSITE